MLPIWIICILIHTSKAMITKNYNESYCETSSNFTQNSSYDANIKLLLTKLSSNISSTNDGFFNFTSGRGTTDTVYGLALCQGYVGSVECGKCVELATHQIQVNCSFAKEAIFWKEECMIHYSNKSIVSLLQDKPIKIWQDLFDASDPINWRNSIHVLVKKITSDATNGLSSGKKFATKEIYVSPAIRLYGFAQCTPDLTIENCQKCLSVVNGSLPTRKTGSYVLTPSCIIRYDFVPFYKEENTAFAPAPNPASIQTSSTGKKKSSRKWVIIAISLVIVILVMFLAISFHLLRRKSKKDKSKDIIKALEDLKGGECLQFDISTLQDATNNFSDDHKLGEGGFGGVFQGSLSNGQQIAVKRLSMTSSQGAIEFKNEIILLAKLQHRNLVRLLGFCLAGEEKLLVYEFVSNKSLNYFLFDPIKRQLLDWPKRYNIIRDIARGMLYLHEDSQPRIIHRDLKASNILLDENMNPKISDFGMARIFGIDQIVDNTNRVVGTYGYMAPEYAMRGQFSTKSDVYSFGVLVLEILSGKKIGGSRQYNDNTKLVTRAWRCWRDGVPIDFMDPILRDSYSNDQFLMCIHVALSCVQQLVEARPSMATIVMMLNAYTTIRTLSIPECPSLSYNINTEFDTFSMSNATSDVSTTYSTNEASITDYHPR